MPYPSTHKPQSREKILSSAAKLFSCHGFDKVSIDLVMADAGLTRGAFYSHFADKSELYAEAINHAAHQRFTSYRDKMKAGGIRQVVDSYLSRTHIDDESNPCPLAFLATDVSQRDPKVRNAYTRVFQELALKLSRLGDAHPDRTRCIAAAALMIGGVAVGRALDDTAEVDELLAACREFSIELLETTSNSLST
jgi:TetR/AcrR family transcriptional repressor of nem operon